MCFTDDFIIQKVKKAMSKMGIQDFIPAKTREEEDDVAIRRNLRDKGHITGVL